MGFSGVISPHAIFIFDCSFASQCFRMVFSRSFLELISGVMSGGRFHYCLHVTALRQPMIEKHTLHVCAGIHWLLRDPSSIDSAELVFRFLAIRPCVEKALVHRWVTCARRRISRSLLANRAVKRDSG
jgi:hypothetical protein